MLKSSKILWMLISLLIVSLMINWLPYVPLSAKINVVYYTNRMAKEKADGIPPAFAVYFAIWNSHKITPYTTLAEMP